jgi:hypothetical protein
VAEIGALFIFEGGDYLVDTLALPILLDLVESDYSGI